MSQTNSGPEPVRMNRRRALAVGGGVAGGLLASAAPFTGAVAAGERHESKPGALPADQIQRIVRAEGTVTSGVLSIDLSRDDIGDVRGPLGVTFTPAFEVDGTLTFQPLKGGRAFFNGDIALMAEETNPVIDAIVANGLTFQAFHQHYDQMTPQIWFIHWRGTGEALHLARAVHNVLAATSIPLPQTMPKHPTTPLDAERLGKILGGDAMVGEEGVVSVEVTRTDTIHIDGIRVSPEANISTGIEFKPLDHRGAHCRCRAGLLHDQSGGTAGDRAHAPTELACRLPLQPGDERAPPALLRPHAQDGRSLPARSGDPQGPRPDSRGLMTRSARAVRRRR